LRELKETIESKNANQLFHEDVSEFQELVEYMLRYPKPIICGVNGWAVGSGVALMLACDIVVADNDAQLSMPESKLGLFAGITAALMAFRIGNGRTSHTMISSQVVDADQAKSIGLFHETVANEFIWARCQEIASQIADGCQQTNLLAKQMLNQTIGEELFTQLSIGSANTAAARSTEAAKEGIDAFLEKREPNW
jgi:enoyl-CoA hydratase/carnithine racemase